MIARGLLVIAILGLACTIPVREELYSPRAVRGGAPVAKLAFVPFASSRALERDLEGDARAVAIDLVSARVLEQLIEQGGFDVVPPEEVRRVLDEQRDSALGPRLRRAFNVDAYLTGTVDRFRERDGSPEGANRPAAVRFALELRSADGGLLWRGEYDEEQNSLTQEPRSLLRAWERRFRWVTAANLAQYGAEELVRRMPRASARAVAGH